MKIEDWFVEKYLDGKIPLPGAAVQVLLNQWLSLLNRLESAFGPITTIVPPETEEIAARSAELMEIHYDMPLAMFTNFLGKSMKYSTGLWETGARNVDEAQEAMMADLCDKADIHDGLKVLDIGCGFGSFAEHVLRRFPDAKVYGLTMSQTQADYLRAKQAESGHILHSDRFYLIQDDFNNVRFDQPFDRIISIGVFEHISNLSKALEKIRTFIAEDGICFLHYIVFTALGGQADTPRNIPFVDRYIFPGGRMWFERELFKHQQHFRIEQHWILGGTNYRRTIQGWLANYLRNYEKIRRETGLETRVLRIWEFYLRGCIANFRVRGGNFYGNGQYLLRPI